MGCKWLYHHLQSQSQPHLPAVHPAELTDEALAGHNQHEECQKGIHVEGVQCFSLLILLCRLCLFKTPGLLSQGGEVRSFPFYKKHLNYFISFKSILTNSIK
ncbi:hypothetical protein PYW07_013516 [Mythimna separata]|uniref:Uncharacterized protein n=1 Tax=Mythimna separata TaxID=271217 RepID=A0AAD8DML5_MYTSE|nr:hypothetical protein PYW07_013514 [Mythimna separata]KAJ8708912.1 hypothetical protein PYW07_013516 [Mythimna separata]